MEQLLRQVPWPPHVRSPRRRVRRAWRSRCGRRLPPPLQRRPGGGHLPDPALPRGGPLGGVHGHSLFGWPEIRRLLQTRRRVCLETPLHGRARERPPARDRCGGRGLRRHRMPIGAEVLEDGLTRFALWAPAAETVDLVLEDGTLPMRREED